MSLQRRIRSWVGQRRNVLWFALVSLVLSMLVTLVGLAGRDEVEKVQLQTDREASEAVSDFSQAIVLSENFAFAYNNRGASAAAARERFSRAALVYAEPYTAAADDLHVAGIDPLASVAPGAVIDPTATIGPFAVIGASADYEINRHLTLGVYLDNLANKTYRVSTSSAAMRWADSASGRLVRTSSTSI